MANYIITSTFSVDNRVHGKWLALINDHYIPFLKRQQLGEVILSKLLNNDATSHTYSMQIRVDSVSLFSKYCNEMFSEYLEIADPLFGEGVLYFNSILKIIE